MYRSLDPEKLLDTISRISRRIGRAFPTSGLFELSQEVVSATRFSIAESEALRRPLWGLRVAVSAGVLALMLIPVVVALNFEFAFGFSSFAEFLEGTDAGVHMLIVLTGGAVFLITGERRKKRNRALNALKDLRSLAHVIDMHQLSKDPGMKSALLIPDDRPHDRPRTVRTPDDLELYLDFSSDLLAVVAKMSALFAQTFNDRDVLVAVNEIETLCNGISRKIWQKLTLMETQRSHSGDRHYLDRPFPDETTPPPDSLVPAGDIDLLGS